MKHLATRCGLFPAVFLSSIVLGLTGRSQEPDERFLSETREYLNRLEKLGNAGVLLIANKGQPVLAEGYGLADRERNLRWSPGTVSTIGSITKQFTGAAILLLEEQGRLDVEDRITEHFESVPEDKQEITLHHLLTHSSGIVDLRGFGDWDPISRTEFVRRSMEQPLAFSPGERYEYSNAGYSLLGAIIEQLTGTSYERFVRENLFAPQGMYETGYILPAWGEERLAQGYRDGGRWGTVLERPLGEDGPYWVLRANGGMHTTAYDMLRWAQALMAGEVLSPESMSKYWAPHVDEGGGTYYGYGWVVMEAPGGQTVITHNGGNGIHFADMAILPDAGVVLFTQTNVVAEAPMASQLLNRVGSRLLAGEPYPSVPEVIAVDASQLRELAGEYDVAEGGSLVVTADSDGLFVDPQDPLAFALLHSTRELDRERVDRLSGRIDEIVSAYVRDDFTPIYEAYRRRAELETLRDSWRQQIQTLEAQHGAFRGHTVLGTALRDDEDFTVVRFLFERGFSDRAYAWNRFANELLLGVSRRGLNPRLRFLPVGDGEFASWDGGITSSNPLRFDRSEDGLRARFGEGEQGFVADRRR